MKLKKLTYILSCIFVLSNFSYSCIADENITSDNKKLVWSDEFNSNTINPNNWTYDIGIGNNGWGNNELQYYTNRSENARVEDGNLIIEAKKENYNNRMYTSARLKTKNLKEFTYGRIEARIKLPLGSGLWPAFWMLGSSFNGDRDWPQCGEIDIMEHTNSDNAVFGSLHLKDGSPKTFSKTTTVNNPEDYHVYAIEWNADKIKWFVDDNLYYETALSPIKINENSYFIPNNYVNNNEAVHKPYFILLNLAVGGNLPKNPNGTAKFPAKMYVDYVRVYSLDN